MALRVAVAYRTVSTYAVLVLASTPTIDLIAMERKRTYSALQEARQENSHLRPKETEAIKSDARKLLFEDWQRRWNVDAKGRWTHRIIKNIERWIGRKYREVTYYVSQAFKGHVGFGKYLYDYKIKESPACNLCREDDVMQSIQCFSARHGMRKGRFVTLSFNK
ncbi:hypothetical protein R5R35_011701 [Gryllus longicercus]|uniref:Uncharacterized protein n=1 Tax=Gryllus longicercus TaxID=2509291 RepID=A0AAN9VM77_9ORTH